MKRISDRRMAKASLPSVYRKDRVMLERGRKAAQAQLESCEKEHDAVIRGIKKRLEKEFDEFAHTDKMDTGYGDDIARYNDYTDRWQAFWQKYEVE